MFESNIFKSIIVLVALMALFISSVLLCRRCLKDFRDRTKKAIHVILTAIHIVITLFSIILFGEYVYPFERKVEPIPYGVLVLPEEYVLDYPGEKFWHGAYEAYGLYAESFYFNTSGQSQKYGISWPPMDFEHYSYIITYGQKIDTLTYNVWDTIDIPVRTGAKVGHMTLQEEFSPDLVYIYRIPKIRLENDINNTCG